MYLFLSWYQSISWENSHCVDQRHNRRELPLPSPFQQLHILLWGVVAFRRHYTYNSATGKVETSCDPSVEISAAVGSSTYLHSLPAILFFQRHPLMRAGIFSHFSAIVLVACLLIPILPIHQVLQTIPFSDKDLIRLQERCRWPGHFPSLKVDQLSGELTIPTYQRTTLFLV